MMTLLLWALIGIIFNVNNLNITVNLQPTVPSSQHRMSSPLLWGMMITVWQVSEAQTFCLPNCQCTAFVADCTLSFCEEQYETMVEVLILRGIMCKTQYDDLYRMRGRTKLELHNAKCTTLRNCE